ncbi:uncharacterized protein [Parasteatoda tepidariorum]|uniref:uncharacterized protein n=1 Tax=Parasteatoda tepidariorum TaxID=114398 RepID=UPI001C71B42A|nr:uncharacterized protein LOC122272496 [Parasteatoda tepidariorum]
MKSWSDYKQEVKKKYLKRVKHANGTGGGPPLKELTELEERVLALIGTDAYMGLTIKEHRPSPVNESIEVILPGSPADSFVELNFSLDEVESVAEPSYSQYSARDTRGVPNTCWSGGDLFSTRTSFGKEAGFEKEEKPRSRNPT